MSKSVDEEEFKKYKDSKEIEEESDIEFSIKGVVLIMKGHAPGASKLSCAISGRSDALIAAITGTMESNEDIKNIIMESAREFVMKDLASMVMKDAMDLDEDDHIDLEKMDVSKEVKDKLKLSELMKGLKPDDTIN